MACNLEVSEGGEEGGGGGGKWDSRERGGEDIQGSVNQSTIPLHTGNSDRTYQYKLLKREQTAQRQLATFQNS